MAADDDKYPASSGRRRFVKGVVGSAALAGVGTATSATINTTTNPSGGGGGPTDFIGIPNTKGPAPRSMPVIPVELDDDGYLQGVFPDWETETVGGLPVQVAEMDIAGYTYAAEWFQYCGMQEAPGIQPENADQFDDYFRYAEDSPYDWQDEEVAPGDRLHIDHFSDFEEWENEIGRGGIGKPAMGRWRSEGVGSGEGIIPVQVMRIPQNIFDRMRDQNSDFADWLDATTEENFIAWMDKCTHFCCVPSFKGTTQSVDYDAEDRVYCPCHQSVYDPYSLIQESFIALPRPE